MANPVGYNQKVVLSEEEIIQIEALAAVLSLEQCADYFGVDKVTFYKIMERQPEVAQRYKNGKANAIKDVAGGLLQAALEGDAVRQMFYLKTQAGWKETKVQEIKPVEDFDMDMLYPPKVPDVSLP